MPRLGARPLRARRDRRLRLRPAARSRARRARHHPRQARRHQSALAGTARPRPHAGAEGAWAPVGHGADARSRDRAERGGPALDLRARPQSAVLHLRGGARLPARHPHPRRRHVRDGLLGLSRLPQRDAADARQGDLARHGREVRDRDAAHVDRQGRHLGARGQARRRAPRRAHRRGHAHLLSRHPVAPPRRGATAAGIVRRATCAPRASRNGKPRRRADPRRRLRSRRRLGDRARDRPAARGQCGRGLAARRAAQDRRRRRQQPLLVPTRCTYVRRVRRSARRARRDPRQASLVKLAPRPTIVGLSARS